MAVVCCPTYLKKGTESGNEVRFHSQSRRQLNLTDMANNIRAQSVPKIFLINIHLFIKIDNSHVPAIMNGNQAGIINNNLCARGALR